MNRFLVLPLLGSVILFAVVLNTQSRHASARTEAAYASHRMNGNPIEWMPLEEAQRMILEPWPEGSSREFFSRRATLQPLTAHLTQSGQETPNSSDGNFLLALYIDGFTDDQQQREALNAYTANPLPLHVDRATRRIRLFHDGRWQNYGDWIDSHLKDLKKITGFGAKG